MSLISKRSLLERIRRGKETRSRLVENNIAEGIAFQLGATREKRGLTQAELAKATGMKPNNISRLESPSYGKHTITSLKRIAEALDVALVVRFVPFTQYINWLSGTPHLDEGISPEALAVPSFEEEESCLGFEVRDRFYRLHTSGTVETTGLVTPSSSPSLLEFSHTAGTYQPITIFGSEEKVAS